MAPLRGWAPCGQRLIGKVPHGRWKTMTFLAALRHDRIEAPWLLEGPIDGNSFRLYLEKVLLPTLRPGDIVIMDNLGSHKGKAARQLIRSAGAKLFFLPKYSPDLNPIEQVFAKLKHLLRKAAARTFEAICLEFDPPQSGKWGSDCPSSRHRQGDLFGNEGPDPSDDAFETPVYYPNPNTVTRGTAPDSRRGARGQDDPLGREPHGALSRYLPADDGVSAGR